MVGHDLTYADAFATAVFVMGVDGLDWLTGQPGYDGMVITHDDRMHSTPGFARCRRSNSSRNTRRALREGSV